MSRTIDSFMDGNWVGAGVLSEDGRIDSCNAVLGTAGDLGDSVTVCEEIERAMARDCPDHSVRFDGHDYIWSLGAARTAAKL